MGVSAHIARKSRIAIVAAAFFTSGGALLAQNASHKLSYTDIAVRIFPLDDAPAGTLAKRDFRLTSHRSRVHFDLIGMQDDAKLPGAFTTFALLDFSASKGSLTPAGVLPKTGLLFKKGWKISILDLEGKQTPYLSTQDELQAALSSPEIAPRSEAVAIRTLSQNAGRHVVFTFCSKANCVPQSSVAATNEVLGILYVINPTSTRHLNAQENDTVPIQTFTGSGDAVISSFQGGGGLTLERPVAKTFPISETSFESAAKDAFADSSQYYDLRLTSTAASQPLTLDVRLPDRHGFRYQIATQLYSDDGQLPTLTLAHK